MNKTSFLLACFVLLAGCAVTSPSMNPDLANCDTQRAKWCRNKDPQAPTVNINTNATKLEADPFCIKVDGGTELVFRLTPRNGTALGDAEIISKNTDHSWLNGKNDKDENYIYIDVPMGLDTSVDYRYGIKIGDKCTDPRVRVEN